VTFDEAFTKLLMKSRLTPQDEADLRDAFENDPGGVETLIRVYARDGIGPDTTAWQDFATDLSLVEEGAAKLAPLITLIISIAVVL